MAVHFVGFRDERYYRAMRIWGVPDFIHYVWDRRARREILSTDTVVFANGDSEQPLSQFNGADIFEDFYCA